MKHVSKFVFLPAVLAAAAVAHAQTVVATVAINAVVNASLSASPVNALNFGSLVQGDGSTTIAPSTSSAGELHIAGSDGQGITITMTTLPTTIAGPSSSSLGVSAYTACYVQSQANQSTCPSTATSQGGQVTGQSLSGSGSGYLFIGATLAAIPGGQTTGSYTGNMTITVSSP